MLRTAFALLALATPAFADAHLPAILVEDAVIFETTPVAKTAAGYMTIKNDSDTTYSLTGVEAGFPSAELHESIKDGEIMRMEPHPDGFEIAPGETLTLERGGKHVMFMGLDQQLKAGTEVKATLIFSDELRVPVTFDVTTPDAAAEGKMDQGHAHHGSAGH